jgi:3-hydroxyisobutyrate dehydrogenase-like beta-hydroxyacid dehydrogenase
VEPRRIQAVKTGDVMEVISHGAVASPLIGYKHAMIRNGDYSAAFMVAQMLKDLSNYCRYRAHWWSTHGMANLVRTQYESAVVSRQ